MPVTYRTAAQYFTKYPVSSIRGGTQFDAYVTPHIVVKAVSRDRLIGSNVKLLAAQKVQAHQGPMTRAEFREMVLPMVDGLLQRLLEMQDGLKARLGPYAVPFEVPEQLDCKIAHLWGLWCESWTFYHPYAQLRVPQSALMPVHLATLRKGGDYDGMQTVIDALFKTWQGIVACGYFPHDPQPPNFAFTNGRVQLIDLGAVWAMGSRVKTVLSSTQADEYVELNLRGWIRVIRGDVADEQVKDLDRMVGRFARSFRDFFTWRTAHQIEVRNRSGRHRNNGVSRVPDVFPFTV